MSKSSISRLPREDTTASSQKFPSSAWLVLSGGLFALGDPGLRAQGSQELIHRQGIDHVCRLQPAASGHGHAMPDELEVWSVVGIGVDDHLYPAFLAHAQV